MASINTNLSAMTALQSLKSTQSSLNKTQSQISTGLRVGSASDNASYWSIATQMKSDNGALSAVKDSISQSKAMIDTFTSAMDKSLTYLNKMKAGLVAATQPGADLAKIQTEFTADIEGMKSAASSASFNGQNWLAQSAPGTVNLVTSYDGNTNTVGTLAIDTSKTNLFTDASAGTGGLLGDVAAIDIANLTKDAESGSMDLDVTGLSDTDVIKFTVSGGSEQIFTVDATAAASVDALVSAFNTAVVAGSGSSIEGAGIAASKDTTTGHLILTVTDPISTVTGSFTNNTAAISAIVGTPVAGTPTPHVAGSPAKAGFATFGGVSSPLYGDRVEITVNGSTQVFTYNNTGGTSSLADLKSQLDPASATYGVTVDTTSGKLVLVANNIGDTVAARYDSGGNLTYDYTSFWTPAASATTAEASYVDFNVTGLSNSDVVTFSLDGGATNHTFNVTSQTSAADLAAAINADSTLSALVIASNESGQLRLTSNNLTDDVTGTFTNNSAGAPAVVGVPIEGTSATPVVSTSVKDALKFVDEAISNVTEGSSMLGANKALLETQEEFIGTLSDSLTAGVSAFVDADMNEASTRLQALQTQQQLGVQALSIANQNSQMILRLFQ